MTFRESRLDQRSFRGRTAEAGPSRRRATRSVRAQFAIAAAVLDLAVVMTSAVAIGLLHHAFIRRPGGLADSTLELSFALASIFAILNVLRNEYAMVNYLDVAGHIGRVALSWNMTFIMALVFMFAVRQTALLSRLPTILFYGVGLVAVTGSRLVLVHKLRLLVSEGRVSLVRIFIVGEESELRRFIERYEPWGAGVDIAASAVLRGRDTLHEDLSLAAAVARIVEPDEIFLLSSWTRPDVIDASVAAFMKVPAALHLGPHDDLDRFNKMRIARTGPITSFNIVRHPLSPIERSAKRLCDVVFASLLLVAFAPLFLLVAIAIKLDSKGPVLFVQRRGGFNQQSFRLYKFRSMLVAEDGVAVSQAVPGDARVTRVGGFIRRTSIDELPQLWNVVRGEMSLVGPRPHAIAHDHLYSRAIADYARRHNVKPGITGWAQIHGLRGATSDAAMETRIAHDLHYIDNWSLALDLRILLRTLLSSHAFKNAY